jgi:hypothetical protein
MQRSCRRLQSGLAAAETEAAAAATELIELCCSRACALLGHTLCGTAQTHGVAMAVASDRVVWNGRTQRAQKTLGACAGCAQAQLQAHMNTQAATHAHKARANFTTRAQHATAASRKNGAARTRAPQLHTAPTARARPGRAPQPRRRRS